MKLEEFISYEQPTNYIVHSDQYTEDARTPVLTAGQSFILGYTDEEDGIYNGEPVVIFDDFTTSVQYVDFPFKVKSSAMKILKNKANANIKFCYYLLSWFQEMPPNHKRQWISTTSQIDINLPSLTEQEAIVKKIEAVSNIIKHRNEELSELDNLIKARFVELFGNPLDKEKANKYLVECVEFNPKKSEVKDLMETEVSFVPMECVGVDGSFTIREDGLVKDYYKGYTYFRNGDVLLAKITPCFENGKVAIAENCTNGIGFGTTEFHVSRPIEGVSNSYWIKYMLKNDLVHDLATINMTGSAGQKRIQTPFFEKLKIYLPPIEQQEQFADFVKQVDKSKVINFTLKEKGVLHGNKLRLSEK